MSTLDLYNSLQISDLKEDNARSNQILEMSQRAEDIKEKTGVRPVSWYEFKKNNFQELKLNPTNKAILGGVLGLIVAGSLLAIGAAAGIGLAGFTALELGLGVASFGIIGSLIAKNQEVLRENRADTKLVQSYDEYLTSFEVEHSRNRGVSSEINYREDHAAKLVAQPAQLSR